MKEKHRLKVYREALKAFQAGSTHCICHELFVAAKKLGLVSGDFVDSYVQELFPDFYALQPYGVRNSGPWYGDPEEKVNQQKRMQVLISLIDSIQLTSAMGVTVFSGVDPLKYDAGSGTLATV